MSEFYLNMCSGDFSFVCLSETWLRSDVLDGELFPENITVYRADRDFAACGKSRGGGVLLAHNAQLKSERLLLTKFNFPLTIDIVAATVLSFSRKITFIVIYVPPDVDQNTYDSLTERLSVLVADLEDQFVMLLGDFNAPNFNMPGDARSRSLLHFQEFSGLTQVSTISNFANRKLDLVFCNVDCTVSRSDSHLVQEDPLHPTLTINFFMQNPEKACRSNPSNIRFNFAKCDFSALYNAINSTNWASLESISNVNSRCTEFYNLLMDSIRAHVPTKQTLRRQFPAWFTRELIILSKLKESARRIYLKQKSDITYNKYSSLRSRFKKLSSLVYKEFVNNTENSIKSNPKNLWKFVNSKRKSSRIPGGMLLNNVKLGNAQSIVNGFAEYFSSVYPASSVHQPQRLNLSETDSSSSMQFTEDDIIKAAKSFKADLTSGYDLIPAFIVRDCAYILAKPLCSLFNLSLNDQHFPDMWKVASICPMFKSGNRSNIVNYRPVSLIPNFSKLFEKCIFNKLGYEIYSRISVDQHGFCKGRSTTTNLVCMTQYIANCLDKGGQVDVIYTDLTKAFDKVDFRILLNKLAAFGFSAHVVNFFMSYLYGRSCIVTYNGFHSWPFTATSGVPQGSILGPILFLIFINELAEVLSCSKLLYADDVKLFTTVNSLEDCQQLQRQLSAMENWCKINKLDLNIPKCNVLSFTRRKTLVNFDYALGNVVIPRSNQLRDLGVIFDSHLRFNDHIEDRVRVASRSLGFITRTCRTMNNVDCMKMLYYAFVRPILEYACTVWSPHYDTYVKSLENIQRKFLKILYFKKHRFYPEQGYPQTELLSEFNVTTLELRRKYFDIKFLNKVLNNELHIDRLFFKVELMTQRDNMRHRILFKIPCPNTNILVNSPLSRLCNLGNRCVGFVDVSTVSTRDLRKLISNNTLNFL